MRDEGGKGEGRLDSITKKEMIQGTRVERGSTQVLLFMLGPQRAGAVAPASLGAGKQDGPKAYHWGGIRSRDCGG